MRWLGVSTCIYCVDGHSPRTHSLLVSVGLRMGCEKSASADSFDREQVPGPVDREELDDFAVTTFCVDALTYQMARSRQNENLGDHRSLFVAA